MPVSVMSDNQQVVIDFIKVVNGNNMDEVMDFFTADCFYHNIPLDPVTGTDAIRAVLEGFNSTTDEIEWTVHKIGESIDGYVLTERTDAFRF